MIGADVMFRELSIPRIIEHAAQVYPDARVASRTSAGEALNFSYRESLARIYRLANGLRALGIGAGDRVATLAWNDHRHFELYYAIAGIGAVCHTINPRLPLSQVGWIVKDAADKALFFDDSLAATALGLRSSLPDGAALISLGGGTETGFPSYEALLADADERFTWPALDERTMSGLCYTSGTTGNPKGACYSHRGTVLHAFSVIVGARECFGIGKRILPLVPLFHVNAWGLPFTAPLSGAGLVLPGPKLDGASLFDLCEAEAVTSSWGVPTVFEGLLSACDERGRAPQGLERVLIGGAPVSEAMIRRFQCDFGIEVLQGWGMTEMSPVGSVTPSDPELRSDAAIGRKLNAGRRLFGVEMRLCDDDGNEMPQDGEASGHLAVKGDSVITRYFGKSGGAEAFDAQGWFRTGDVAKITPTGDMSIVDRSKDLIKSGGEWIASIDIENAALLQAGIARAAAIAVPHHRWGERPLLVLELSKGAAVDLVALREGLSQRLAKWQIPEEIEVIEAMPLTATGKISKLELRAIYSKAM